MAVAYLRKAVAPGSQLRPQVPGNISSPSPAASGWRGLEAAVLGHPWAGKAGAEGRSLLQALVQPGAPTLGSLPGPQISGGCKS